MLVVGARAADHREAAGVRGSDNRLEVARARSADPWDAARAQTGPAAACSLPTAARTRKAEKVDGCTSGGDDGGKAQVVAQSQMMGGL